MYLAYAGIGSRKTPLPILELMTYAALRLHTLGWTLRSGGADGADTAFEMGALGKAEIFLPWPKFNGRISEFQNPSPLAVLTAPNFVRHWGHCSQGAQKLHARNLHQVLGWDLNTPAKFLLCWTENGEVKGGTATAIKVAEYTNIPVFNFGNQDPEAIAQGIDSIVRSHT